MRRKVAFIVNQTRGDRLSARELKERIRTELTENISDEAIDRALSMLSMQQVSQIFCGKICHHKKFGEKNIVSDKNICCKTNLIQYLI